jgi:hypothetical protein
MRPIYATIFRSFVLSFLTLGNLFSSGCFYSLFLSLFFFLLSIIHILSVAVSG